MRDVRAGVFVVHGQQLIADGNALGKLAQPVICQKISQFRLAGQHNLDELVRLCFQVGNQPDLLQHLRIEILGFIDYQHHGAASAVFPEQESVQFIE